MQREIDRSGLRVKAIGLGAMPLSIAGRPEPEQAFRVIEAFVDAGGDFIDTANVYCLDDSDIGHNERLIHNALTRLGRRDEVLVATKGGLRRPRGDWTVDGSPEWLRTSCEQSLAALGTERHHPLPAPCRGPRGGFPGNAGGAHRAQSGREDPAHRPLERGPRAARDGARSTPPSPRSRTAVIRSRKGISRTVSWISARRVG